MVEERQDDHSWCRGWKNIDHNKLQSLLTAIHKTEQNLAIKKLNDVVGYSLVTTKPIEEGEAVGVYAGHYLYKTIDVIEIQLMHSLIQSILIRLNQ